MKVTVAFVQIGTLGILLKTLAGRLEELEIRGRIEAIQTKIGQNTENPGDLRSDRILSPGDHKRLAVNWNQVKEYQPILV